MENLKLPKCDLQIKNEEGNQFVLDIVRKKYVVLTAEEWVRQHFIHLLIDHLKYPRALIRLESKFHYFKSGKRSDIIVMDRSMNPFLLVECKAPDIPIKRTAINQIAVYNKVLRSKFIALTNGMNHFIWEFSREKYHPLDQFPEFPRE